MILLCDSPSHLDKSQSSSKHRRKKNQPGEKLSGIQIGQTRNTKIDWDCKFELSRRRRLASWPLSRKYKDDAALQSSPAFPTWSRGEARGARVEVGWKLLFLLCFCFPIGSVFRTWFLVFRGLTSTGSRSSYLCGFEMQILPVQRNWLQ